MEYYERRQNISQAHFFGTAIQVSLTFKR